MVDAIRGAIITIGLWSIAAFAILMSAYKYIL